MLAYGDRLRRVAGRARRAGRLLDRPHRAPAAGGGPRRTPHPPGQRVDVEFGEFMADDLAMATSILGHGRPRAHRPAPHRAHDLPGRQPARQGGPGRSTTCAATSGSIPTTSTTGSPSTSTRSPRSPGRSGEWRASTGSGPGADAIAPCRGEPAVDLGDGIWMSPGLSNSYLLATDDGRDRGQHRHGLRRPAAPPGVRRRRGGADPGHRAHPGPLRPRGRRRRRSATRAPS